MFGLWRRRQPTYPPASSPSPSPVSWSELISKPNTTDQVDIRDLLGETPARRAASLEIPSTFLRFPVDPSAFPQPR